jgi:hypothetical protein
MAMSFISAPLSRGGDGGVHFCGVIPHLPRELDGVADAFPSGKRGSRALARSGVTTGTAFFHEQTPSAADVATIFKETRHIEIGEQMGRAVGSDAGLLDFGGIHGGPHGGGVVPHLRGHAGGGIASPAKAAEVRAGVAAFAAGAVASEALLAF